MKTIKLCDKSTKADINKLPSGVWSVVLTPFNDDGGIDWSGYDKLLEWYAGHGCSGMFASCLSSELYELTSDERLKLAARAVDRSDVPIVAAGYLGESRTEKLDSLISMSDTGVDTVVIPVCQIVGEEQSDDELLHELEFILENTGDIPLGLYECPAPYHRLLSPEIIGWCAATGRFKFLKDTCCDLETIKSKIDRSRGSSLQVYNAYIHTLFESIVAGGAGFNGLAASFFPETLQKLVECVTCDVENARELQLMASAGQSIVKNKYPRGAKHFLKLRGVDISSFCRADCPELDGADLSILKAFSELVEKWNSNH